MRKLTLVKHVLVLLACLAAAGSRVELVAETAEEASSAGLVLVLGLDRDLGLLLLAFLVAAAGQVLDEIHDCLDKR